MILRILRILRILSVAEFTDTVAIIGFRAFPFYIQRASRQAR